MQESFLNSPLVYSIALTLIHFLWQGLLVSLALKTALLFTPYQKSQLRYAFSSGAMILNFIIPLITFFILYKPNSLQFTPYLSEITLNNLASAQASINNSWHSNLLEYLPYITIIWLFTISTLSLRLFIQLYSVNQLRKNNTLLPENDLVIRFQKLSQSIGLKKTPHLLLSLNAHVPMAIGWLKPIVLLPVNMLTGLTPSQLDMLILHELAHIRRHDYLVNFIQSIVEIVLFFHPCVLWVSNQMRNEREYCSDDIAVKHSGNAIAYAHTLADTASLCNQHRHHSIPKMAMAASGGDLTQRVMRLVNDHHCASSNTIGKWSASFAVLFVIIFVSSQHLITLLNVKLEAAASYSSVKIIDPPVFNEDIDDDVSELNTPVIHETVNKGILERREELMATPTRKLLNNTDTEKQKTTYTFTANQYQNNQQIATKNKSKIEAALNTKSANSNAVLDDFQKKSPSDLAFEKTDNRSTLSPSHNSYSKQIQELNIELNKETPNLPSTPSHEVIGESELSTFFELEKKASIKQNNAKLIYSVTPKYPVKAEREGIEIEVKVDFTIDVNGYVKNLVFPPIKYQRNYFTKSIRAAVDKWRFIPAQSNGKAIESRMSKIFSFNIK